jgi:deoxyribonuclease V
MTKPGGDAPRRLGRLAEAASFGYNGAVLACADVHYRQEGAVAACVLFSQWRDAAAAGELRASVNEVEPYEPGEFFRRELPCILRVLEDAKGPLETIVIDGYVWLDGAKRPGLGARLYEALGGQTPVIGVAKTLFRGAGAFVTVMRGESKRPLYVTSAGIDVNQAAALVRSMHGEHRIPTLLKAVDRLCRRP